MGQDAITDTFTSAMQIMLKDSTHKKPARASVQHMERLKIALEGYMIDAISMELSDVLARIDHRALAVEDETLNKRTRNLQDLTVEDIGLPGALQHGLPVAQGEIARLNIVTTPLEKLLCLHKSFKTLSDALAGEATVVISADEMVPLISILVIRSDIPNWHTNLFYMSQLRFSGATTEESGYLLVTLEAALAHIRSDEFRSMATSRDRSWSNVSADLNLTLSASSDLHPAVSLTKQFFAAIVTGDQAEVLELLAKSQIKSRTSTAAALTTQTRDSAIRSANARSAPRLLRASARTRLGQRSILETRTGSRLYTWRPSWGTLSFSNV